MLKKRVYSSILASTLVIAALALPPVVFVMCLALVIALGLNELFYLFRKNNILDNSKFAGIFAGVLIPFFFYLSSVRNSHYSLGIIVIVVFMLFIHQFLRKDKHQVVMNIAVVTLGVLYISVNMSFMVKIKMMPSGGWLILYMLLVAKFGDIGAYFIGSKFGKNKLIPRISPNKSIEGSIGGLLFSIVISIIAAPILTDLSFTESGFLGFVLGILAQSGDLVESLIKRDCEAKDSGVFVPGLGGVLDIIDSVIFVIPAFYFYLVMVR